MVNVKGLSRIRLNELQRQRSKCDHMEEFVVQIRATWQKAVESIIETGSLLNAAKSKLEHGQFLVMIGEKLPFGERTAQMLMLIARHPILSNTKYVSHLPPSWATLHALAQVPDDELLRAIDAKLVTPQTRLNEAKQLCSTRFDQLAPSLKVLLNFMRLWRNPKDLVNELVEKECGNLSDAELYDLEKLPTWIAALQVACQQVADRGDTNRALLRKQSPALFKSDTSRRTR